MVAEVAEVAEVRSYAYEVRHLIVRISSEVLRFAFCRQGEKGDGVA